MQLTYTHDTPGFLRHKERTPQRDRSFKGWLLPYGVWTLKDGTQVMFDRYYAAIWQRSPGGTVTKADMNIWYPWIKQDYFRDVAAGKSALKEWLG